jgi:phosphoribosylanthranilate isomerase
MWVKICGTTSEEDALLAVAMGADAVGFIFAPSPRQIAPQVASDIVNRLPPEIDTVGVFRDEAPERVVAICHRSGLRVAQLHGNETPAHAQWVAERMPMTIKAFPAGSSAVARARDYGTFATLLDAPNPGSGEVFDWAFAGEMPTGLRLIVAGGLHSGNVAGAINRTHPWGVDVSTGVESSPGHKDPVKLLAFVTAVRAAAPDGPDELAEGDLHGGPYDWQEK